MRNPKRIPEVLSKVEAFWTANPDLRLGQVISFLASVADQDPFYIEDHTLTQTVDKVTESETQAPTNAEQA